MGKWEWEWEWRGIGMELWCRGELDSRMEGITVGIMGELCKMRNNKGRICRTLRICRIYRMLRM